MNNYRKKYQFLSKNIEEIKSNKQLLEEKLKNKEVEYELKENSIDELKDTIIEKESNRYQIVKSKEKIIDIATNILILALLSGTIAIGVFVYNAISPIGLIIKFLTITGLTTGNLIIFSLGFTVIKNVDKYLKKKNIIRNKKKQEYQTLTEKINNMQEQLEKEMIEFKQICKEMNTLKKDLNIQIKLLSSKEKELAQLIEEIVQFVIKEEPISEEIINNPEVITTEEKTKPHARVKKNIGYRR